VRRGAHSKSTTGRTEKGDISQTNQVSAILQSEAAVPVETDGHLNILLEMNRAGHGL